MKITSRVSITSSPLVLKEGIVANNDILTFEEFKILADTGALNGGEDYELLFTINQKDYEKIQKNDDIHVIGHITDKSLGCQLVTPQNTTIELKAQGWNHYKNKEEN